MRYCRYLTDAAIIALAKHCAALERVRPFGYLLKSESDRCGVVIAVCIKIISSVSQTNKLQVRGWVVVTWNCHLVLQAWTPAVTWSVTWSVTWCYLGVAWRYLAFFVLFLFIFVVPK